MREAVELIVIMKKKSPTSKVNQVTMIHRKEAIMLQLLLVLQSKRILWVCQPTNKSTIAMGHKPLMLSNKRNLMK
jgi:hypothetical protein